MLKQIRTELKLLANPEKSKILQSFFKTRKGEYGEGDVFLGVTVPEQRKVARKYRDLSLEDLQKLLASRFHEHRLTALLILVTKYQIADETGRKEIFNFYLDNINHVNNWDLVDLSADKILGNYLLKRDKSILYKLAESDNLWERRTAIVSTFHFIKNNRFTDTLRIASLLLNDDHDLIHKAVGWMLREVGKRDLDKEEQFLLKHYMNMPRTMLRYAIERFNKQKKTFYMKK